MKRSVRIFSLKNLLLLLLAFGSPSQYSRAGDSSQRWKVTDTGVVLTYGDGPGQCDEFGARDVSVWVDQGTYYMHYDGAGPKGWLACLATSTDLIHWTKKGAVLDLGTPPADDSGSASYGTTYKEITGNDPSAPQTIWHMFYLGTPNTTPPSDRIPSPPYLTMKARSNSPSGPWVKEPQVIPFRPSDYPIASYGASSIVNAAPGMIIKNGDEYMMFVSWGGYSSAGTAPYGNIGIARTHNLEGKWTIDPKPMLPGSDTCENASLYFEPTNQTWFLFVNHIGPGYFTDSVWVYWSKDINNWDAANQAVVLDGTNCTWSKACIGLPSVLKVGNRLAIYYDAAGGTSTSHMNRDVGLAWLDLPLQPPTSTPAPSGYAGWAAGKFTAQQLSDSTISGPGAIPQKDGVSNLLKYLFDINPTVVMSPADEAALPVAGVSTFTIAPAVTPSTYLTLTYRQNLTQTGLTITVQTSPDLQTWTTVTPDRTQNVGTDGTTGDPLIQVQAKTNPQGASKEFIRLQVAEQ